MNSSISDKDEVVETTERDVDTCPKCGKSDCSHAWEIDSPEASSGPRRRRYQCFDCRQVTVRVEGKLHDVVLLCAVHRAIVNSHAALVSALNKCPICFIRINASFMARKSATDAKHCEKQVEYCAAGEEV